MRGVQLAEVFARHARVVVCGGPRAGKTSACLLSGRWVLSTDLYLEEGAAWDDVPALARADAAALGSSRWALEGCRAPWCLRAGLEADAAAWLSGAREELSAGQQALAKAARSVWDAWLETAAIPAYEL